MDTAAKESKQGYGLKNIGQNCREGYTQEENIKILAKKNDLGEIVVSRTLTR